MGVDDLARLTVGELRRVCKMNLRAFHTFSIANLVVFYHSLYMENWLLLFISFGLFISCMAVFDNYKTSSRLLDKSTQEGG